MWNGVNFGVGLVSSENKEISRCASLAFGLLEMTGVAGLITAGIRFPNKAIFSPARQWLRMRCIRAGVAPNRTNNGDLYAGHIIKVDIVIPSEVSAVLF